MINISTKTLAAHHEKITLTIDTKKIKDAFEKIVKKQAKQATISGFRKGMVPPSLIKRSKGDILFTQELFRQVEQELVVYLKKEKYQLIGQPLMTNIPEGITHKIDKEYVFDFEVGTRPSFEDPDISKHEIENPILKITADIVKKEIEMQQRKHGKFEEREKVESEEDIVHLSFLEWDQEKKQTLGKESTNVLLVKYFHSQTEKLLIGKKVADVIIIQLEKAFGKKELDWILSDLNIKDQQQPEKTYYQLTITKIGHITPQPLNKDLYKKMYPQDTPKNEEEFHKAITADLNNSLQQQITNYIQEQVYRFWIEQTKMELPTDFLQKWYTQNEAKDSNKSKEEIAKQFVQFLPQLKWTIISEELAKKIKLEVTQKEIMQAMKDEVFKHYGENASDKQLHEAIKQLLNNSDYIYSTQQRIRNQKVLDWGTNQARLKDINMSVEDFNKKLERKE